MIQDIFSRGAQLMLMMGMMKWVQNIMKSVYAETSSQAPAALEVIRFADV